MVARLLIAVLLSMGAAMAAAQVPVQPRIVLQAGSYVEVAAWTADDRFIITASATTRNVTIWDVEKAIIVDRLSLPTPDDIGNDLVILTGMEISADQQRAVLRGRRVARTDDGFDRPQTWVIDLQTRRITAAPSVAGTRRSSDAAVAEVNRFLTALAGATGMGNAEIKATLPPLPASHDGRWQIERAEEALGLRGRDGRLREIKPSKPLSFSGAALSPDGERLALVEIEAGTGSVTESRVMFDTPFAGGAPASILRPGTYGRAQWIDKDLLLVTADDTDDSRDPEADGADVPPSPPLILDSHGQDIGKLPPRCHATPLSGAVIAAGLANCRAIKADRSIWMAGEKLKWVDAELALPADAFVDRITVDPNGQRAALALTLADKTVATFAMDIEAGTELGQTLFPEGATIEAMSFAPDGKSAFLQVNTQVFRWNMDAKAAEVPTLIGVGSLLPEVMVSDGRTLAVAGALDGEIARFDLGSGSKLPPFMLGNVIAGNFLPDRGLFWAVSGTEGLRIWDTRTGAVLLTTYFFDDDNFFTVTPEGRYDTNLPADAPQFRWLMPDAPWQSLGPQTFMRDYFEPDLAAKLFRCRAAGDCGKVFPPQRPLAQLNRVLPEVRIESIVPGATPGTAVVTVAANEGTDVAAARAGRKAKSGLYNLRLFRDGRLVGQYPENPPESAAPPLPEWQRDNRLPVGADGIARRTFTVQVPTNADGAKPVFTAYAFNEDRVKGETARRSYARPAVAARPRRAFILAIGIDDYAQDRLRLHYAAADARLLDAQLARMPGRDIRRLVLTGEPGKAHATKALIGAALNILAGENVDAARGVLAAAGIDARGFEPATPDDLMVLTYAGHGWAADNAEFFLVPSDGRWPDGAPAPDRGTLISASELTLWLRGIDAGEMAFIIDACQSGASVDKGYKPGPMGDPGLGQLAFDKGMLILTATQAAEKALEDPRLGHGLLTYTLAAQGIDDRFGKADMDADGTIDLDEWLRYGVEELPGLAKNVASATWRPGAAPTARGGFGISQSAPRAPPQVQRPSLFDFTDVAGSPLRTKGGR